MCGITGIIDLRERREINRELLKHMNNTMTHRGPDESGVFQAPGVGLAHRRLSIIDLSSGQQPLSNQDKTVTVTFNGEIYNFQSLSQELKAKGYVFKTHSDTEVIVHAWSEWGEACVQHFRGMFAFIIWDARAKRLFIARDRLGIKPVFYAKTRDGYLIVASELKAILAHPAIEKKLKPQSVEDYFALGYIPEPKTIFEDIYKLPAGHTLSLSVSQEKLTIQQYWDAPFTPQRVADQAQLQDEFKARLTEAINIRMVAEVPLGAFLSGGVDSSAVVAIMAGLQNTPVNTCSIGFNEADFDESDYAKMVAAQYHTNHHLERVDAGNFELIDRLAQLYDEPYADSSALPTYQVCQLARKHVTVALSGDGADELMSGYRRHKWHMKEEAMRARLPMAIRSPLFGVLGKMYPKADWAPQMFRAKSTFQALARDSVSAYFHSVSQTPDYVRSRLFSESLKRDLSGYNALEVFRLHAEKAPTDDPLGLIQYLDMKTYLVDDILTKVDRASMAHALEVRVPILDHEFVEWVTGLPSGVKLNRGVGKSIFKSTMGPLLPKEILHRRKMGFSIPLADWFRGPLKDKVKTALLGEALNDTQFFNAPFLNTVVNEHQRGMKDHSTLIWSLMMFESFVKQQAVSV